MSVFCTSCGQANGDGAAFCDSCGSTLNSGCPECGAENRPEARFCRSCGTHLADADVPTPAPAPAGTRTLPASADGGTAERRLVSVLFADLVSFTSYSEGRDPELVRETLTRYFEATRHAIEHHGGRVEKFIGDAVMAAWGAPRANEDDAERAVRAALEVVEAVRNLNEGLEARVGVLTGHAAVTVGATDQGMVAGDMVNTAARLQAAAPPSTVLVGEATMQAASGAIAFEEAGEQVLRGKTAPVPAWRALRVIGDRGGRSRGEGLEPPFVGRELELRLLKDLVHAVDEDRRPRLVSITGPAGIGKSRLAWEFEKYLDGLVDGVYWHRGRAPSYGDGVTFWALGEMVRKRAGLLESDDENTTRERVRATVEEWVPDQKDRAWVEPALLTLLGLEPPPAGGRDVLFAAWRIFFERVAAHGTTILLFEDLQWADSGQLDFIDHLMEWARDVPLLVVTLARPELLERRPGWGTTARAFNAVGLEPLTPANMRELLLGLVPGLPADAVSTVLERADGIPLYAVETVRMLVADGRLLADGDGTFRPAGELGELAMPDSLRALIASRLDALDDADRTLLQDAAVLGKTFTPDAIAAIYGQDEAEIASRLRALSRRELLEIAVDPASPERGQFGFVQSVVREVAYETLSRRDRRTRHLAAARYFEGLGDEELAGVLSTHYMAAYEASEPGPEADALRIQARLALQGAAERAMDLGAYDQARLSLQRALSITEDAAERASLLERAAAAADIEGAYEEAERLGREALAAYESIDDHTGAARTSARLGMILLNASRLTETVELLESALAKADRPEDAKPRAEILASLSRAHMRLLQTEQALARADEALAIAEPLRLRHTIGEAFINKAGALSQSGRLVEPIVLMSAAVDLAHEQGDMALELRARNNLAATQGTEDGDAAMRVSREAYALATRLGIRQMSTWLAGAIAQGALYEGLDWDTALRQVDTEIDGSMSDADRVRLLSLREALMAFRGDDRTELLAARERLTVQISDPDEELSEAVNAAHASFVDGRIDEALAAYAPYIRAQTQNSLEARWGYVLAAQFARDPEAARRGLEALDFEPYAGTYVDGVRRLAEAGVAALEGQPGAALASYRAAIEAWRACGARFDVAIAQMAALTSLPDEPSIEGWADEARERFEIVRSPALLERLEQVLATRAIERANGTQAPEAKPANAARDAGAR